MDRRRRKATKSNHCKGSLPAAGAKKYGFLRNRILNANWYELLVLFEFLLSYFCKTYLIPHGCPKNGFFFYWLSEDFAAISHAHALCGTCYELSATNYELY
jgi:hypothetical protein